MNLINTFFNVPVLLDSLPQLLRGLLVTLQIGVTSILIGLAGGLFLAVARLYAPAFAKLLIRGYVDIFRSIPLLVLLIVVYYALPFVGIRLSPATPNVGNTPLDSDPMATYGHLIQQLNPLKLAYLHFVEGATGGSRDVPAHVDLDALRAQFEGAYIGNNGYDLELAVKRRAAGLVDAVAFGRPFIGNPDLVERLHSGAELVQASHASYYGRGAEGYTDWPALSDSLPA